MSVLLPLACVPEMAMRIWRYRNRTVNPSSPCEKCAAAPQLISVPGAPSLEIPASIAWLETDDLFTMYAKDQTIRPRRPVDEGRDLLTTVILSLAARNRITLYE